MAQSSNLEDEQIRYLHSGTQPQLALPLSSKKKMVRWPVILIINIAIIIILVFIQKYQIQQQKIEICNKQIKRRKKLNPKLTLSDRVHANYNKKPFERYFDETPSVLKQHPSFKYYSKDHSDYLVKNNVSSVFEIGCEENCKKNYQQLHSKLNISYFDSKAEEVQKKYDWIVIRQPGINTSLVAFTKIASKSAEKGISIILKNMDQLRIFNSMFRSFVFELAKQNQLTYDQTSSLGLRRREGRIIFIFTKNPKKVVQYPFEKPIKNLIGIQVVAKLNENLFHLREWIGYHIYLGIDKFFIYDYNGALGSLSDTNKNKQGLKSECFNLTQAKIAQQWNQIWQDYYEHIVYIPWQYQNRRGQIIEAQLQAQADFIQTYEDVITYVGFINTDEMLFSQFNLNFAETLSKSTVDGYTSIGLLEKKFTNRFCHLPKHKMMQINETFGILKIKQEGQKLFFQSQNFIPFGSIHQGLAKEGKRFVCDNTSKWRLNQYTLTEESISSYQKKNITNQTKLSYDGTGAQSFGQVLEKICEGKCSQKFKLSCEMQGCPQMNKEYPINHK